MLTFYAIPQSVYCAKVRGAFRLKNIEFDEQPPAGGSYQTTEYQQTVAAGSVPAIREGNWVLHDSQAILEFIEEHYAGPSLWSPQPRARAEQRALLNYHDSKLEPVVRELVPLVSGRNSNEHSLQLGLVRDRLFDRLYRLDRMLVDYGWQGAKTGSAADWTIPCTLRTAIELLGFLDRTLDMPGALGTWFNLVRDDEIACQEIETVSNAIGEWLARQL